MKPKNALVLYKTSMYNYYKNQVPPSERPPQFEIERFRETHERHYQCVNAVVDNLKDRGIRLLKSERGKLRDYSSFDLIVTVGGDGTFLEGARYTRQQLIFGVNSDPAWSVGKLCGANAQTFSTFFDHILNDEHDVQYLNRLVLTAPKLEYEVHFFNDILVAHLNPAGLSRYVLEIDGRAEEQRGSGLWISTAAGSTGAIFSAGGQAMNPESDAFQYLPRELYRAWNHNDYVLTGGILPASSVIRMTSLMEAGMIFVEGSHEKILFPAHSEIYVRRSPYPLHVVRQ